MQQTVIPRNSVTVHNRSAAVNKEAIVARAGVSLDAANASEDGSVLPEQSAIGNQRRKSVIEGHRGWVVALDRNDIHVLVVRVSSVCELEGVISGCW